TKDYAKRRRNQHFSKREHHSKSNALPGWMWMVTGLLLGVGLSAVLYLKLHKTPNPIQNTIVDIHEDNSPAIEPKPSKKPKQVAQNQQQEPAKQSSSRFDFYTVLPKMHTKDLSADPSLASTKTLDMALQKDVTMPEQNALVDDEPDISKLAQDAPKQAPTGNYFIQAGSFRRLEQADKIKAELAISGFEARIQTFKMGDRDYRYRVLIGPFSSKDQAQNQQMHLEQALQLHSVVLKISV
ncbi:MAG: SPOR domain-containing protein, partial [Candidatus Berkiella sp.]